MILVVDLGNNKPTSAAISKKSVDVVTAGKYNLYATGFLLFGSCCFHEQYHKVGVFYEPCVLEF